jgi:hypothetical protein
MATNATRNEFALIICDALVKWGHNYNGSRIQDEMEKMVGKMTAKQVKDMEAFVGTLHGKTLNKNDVWPALTTKELDDVSKFVKANPPVKEFVQEIYEGPLDTP